jgi:GTP-binding protein
MADNNFIDYVKIHCTSGPGGAGSTHMLRTKGNAKGGPDGGDGGRGGHIVLRGNTQMWTLLHLKYRKHIKAEPGGGGDRNNRIGASGEDVVLQVPLGTIVKDAETGDLLAEIAEDGQEIILMEGGRGGKGNDFFKSSTNRAPRYAQPGGPSQEGWIILELKVLADVGLVGFPNAGKSTLLSVLSAAKPEIADYPFTTLVPQLGIVSYRDYRSFVLADIPGIIEGASEGKGLGHRFLKHIERNAVLLFLVPADSPDAAKEYKILLAELKKFNPQLLTKHRVVAISKSDLLDDELARELRATFPKKLPVVFFSSVAQLNLEVLKDRLWESLQES